MAMIDHGAMLRALLPPGDSLAGENVGKLLDGFAPELGRATARTEGLIQDFNPLTTVELISEWEATVGITEPASTLVERRGAVMGRLRARGGQTKAYFMQVAALMGWTIEIGEFFPFVAGSSAGDYLAGDEAVHGFVVFASPIPGADSVASQAELEATINRLKPAHSAAIFEY